MTPKLHIAKPLAFLGASLKEKGKREKAVREGTHSENVFLEVLKRRRWLENKGDI